MKLALILAAALAAVLLFLLAFTSGNTAFFAQYYPWLLALNGLAALGMLVMISVQLIYLRRDFKAGVFGARLKSRLLVMLALMAVLPGALVYAVSMQFAVNSIDSWFDVRVDRALEGGLELGRSVLDNLQGDLLEKTRKAALELGDSQMSQSVESASSQLNRLREQMGAGTATLLTLSGQTIASSVGDLNNLLPQVPSTNQLRSARSGRGLALVSEDTEGLTIRTLVPVFANTTHLLEFEPRILQFTQRVPAAIAKNASNAEAGYRNYQELQLGRSGLKRIYTLTLTLTLMLALFAAVALAFLLAERLAQPLLILAEGTRAVSAGDFTPRTIIETSDELGLLTRSFNNMTRQLSEARAEADLQREKTEAAQAYLESVLGNLSAGVLAFSTDFHLRAANRGALTILHDDLAAFEKIPLSDWPRHHTLATTIIEAFTRHGDEWQQQLDLTHDDHAPQTLLIRGTALPATGGGGFVVVFDDITRLISAQRSAAWAEVAQRLAHEIKNPLTPIQLSAERLQMKLSTMLDEPSRALLDRATHTIITQVEALKSMVNTFRDYARTPPPQLAEVDLYALVIDVLALYENTSTQFTVSPAPTFSHVLADINQMRQVLHNLFANAQDALANVAQPRIDIRIEQDKHRLRLTLHDNGAGFSPQMLARAFEPYVTTKTKGTGLGLAIVKKIIDDHGGEIRLANHDGGEVSLWLLVASGKKTTSE
ncbi:MAG: ATP-binding protein [Rugosibacter sp.]|jgi:nitrogen fixation/metabolism regulation signal transduction histidine kinase|nr:ATP-binding protein [Rugosibacter sp.]MDO9273013.1 ATP-binding protein [Rugosibacter sp.]